MKDVVTRDQARKIESLEENLQDYENTIGQFRELVLQLQSCVPMNASDFQTLMTNAAT